MIRADTEYVFESEHGKVRMPDLFAVRILSQHCGCSIIACRAVGCAASVLPSSHGRKSPENGDKQGIRVVP